VKDNLIGCPLLWLSRRTSQKTD